tara:strand:- start:421 stop:645 length:225 start_codon:yes stop_codon:yes gene_type:complete
MEPVYWFAIAYIVGTGFGFWIGSRYGIGKGVVITLETLVNGGYVKTRTVDGELDLIKLTFEERLDDNATESKNS